MGGTDCQCLQRLAAPFLVPGVAHVQEALDLIAAHGIVIDIENLDIGVLRGRILIDPYDDVLTTIHTRLSACGRFFDSAFGQTRFHSLGHAACRLHLIDELGRLLNETRRQRFQVVGTRQRIDDIRNIRLLAKDQLRVASHSRGKLGWQTESLVEGVGVQ